MTPPVADRFDPAEMDPTEYELRRALCRVTYDVAEDDFAEQAAGWRQIANAANKRANQFLRAALKG